MTSRSISFEFFPPKSVEGMSQLASTASELATLRPHFFSMTYGAGGSTRNGTVEAVTLLQQRTPIPLAPHIACVGATREQMVELLQLYQTMGVQRMVALRGDLPSGMGQFGEFKYASELVAFIREQTADQFDIEVAAYPEIHPQAQTTRDDLLNLKRKFEAGANSAITQYFFNPDAYFWYVDECARLGIHMPIVPGIMPITQYSKLVRFSEMCGAEIPRWIRKRLEMYADDMPSIQAAGYDIVHELCERLLKGGAPGLHFYTLNKHEPVMAVLENLGIVPSKQSNEYLLKSFSDN